MVQQNPKGPEELQEIRTPHFLLNRLQKLKLIQNEPKQLLRVTRLTRERVQGVCHKAILCPSLTKLKSGVEGVGQRQCAGLISGKHRVTVWAEADLQRKRQNKSPPYRSYRELLRKQRIC